MRILSKRISEGSGTVVAPRLITSAYRKNLTHLGSKNRARRHAGFAQPEGDLCKLIELRVSKAILLLPASKFRKLIASQARFDKPALGCSPSRSVIALMQVAR